MSKNEPCYGLTAAARSTTVLLTFIAVAVFLDMATLSSAAVPGDLDPSFDAGSGFSAFVRTMAVQSDGKLVVGGGFTNSPGARRTGLARFNVDGSLDSQFSPNLALAGNPFAIVTTLALQADGKILLSGAFTSVNGIGRTNLARLNSDGSLDESFLNGAGGPGGGVFCLFVQNGAGILVGGSFTNFNGAPRQGLVRLDERGNVDTTFLANCSSSFLWNPDFCIRSIVEESGTGKLYAGGTFTAVNGINRTNLARLNPNGDLDTGFPEAGIFSDPYSLGTVFHVALGMEGQVVVSGMFNQVQGQPRRGLARLTRDGVLDLSFRPDPNCLYELPLAWDRDGKLLVGGAFYSIAGSNCKGLVRLNRDGSLDEDFAANMDAPWDLGVYCLLPQSDGTIYVAGGFRYETTSRVANFLCRLTSSGTIDTNFWLGRTGPDGEVFHTSVQADGSIYVGGAFCSINGIPRGRVARLEADGSLDRSFLEGLSGANDSVFSIVVQPDQRVIIAGGFSTVNGVARQGIARLEPSGALDYSFSNNLGGYVFALALQEDGQILAGGEFRSSNLVRLFPDGSVDTSFAVNMSGSLGIQTLAVQADGKILIGGRFSKVNGATKAYLARLNRDGSLDDSFAGAPEAAATSLAARTDGGIFIGGYFECVNGVQRRSLARLLADGTLDDSFLNGMEHTSGYVSAISPQDDGRVLAGGSFNWLSNNAAGNLVCLDPNGHIQPAFFAGRSGPDGQVWSISKQRDGRVLIGGGFASVNGTPRSSVARLIGFWSPPAITSAPQSRTVEVGQPASLWVQVSGSQPISYTWVREDKTCIAQGTNCARLELSSARSSDAGEYAVIATNTCGAITSAPVSLQVIAPVEKTFVLALSLDAAPGTILHLDSSTGLSSGNSWTELGSVAVTSSPQSYIDGPSLPMAPRFYRAWSESALDAQARVGIALVPALTLLGAPGTVVRVDWISPVGPIDAWAPSGTVEMTNSSQRFYDWSGAGKPARLYRVLAR